MSLSPNKITVMLVDDSSVIRRAISNILDSDPAIEVIASVSDGVQGIAMAKARQPDIIILDVEMPIMDGLTALPEILKSAPKSKVVMCSSLTAKGANTTIKAMALGAVECLVKPTGAAATGEDSPFKKKLLNIIRSLAPRKAALAPPLSGRPSTSVAPRPIWGDKTFELRDKIGVHTGKPDILAIGSSTGGPKALFQVLKDIGKLDIPIVVTQHMPATFTKILAEHITQQTGVQAYEGEDGMIVQSGCIYVAPGDRHMLFERSDAYLKIKLNDGPEESFCKPAVDPMLRSLSQLFGKKILCLILTGMGQDGMKGGQILTQAGGRVIAQDEETSVVWGMPGAAAMAGICSAVLPLPDIGSWVQRACL